MKGDIPPRRERSPMNIIWTTEAGQMTEACLRGTTPKGDIPQKTETDPHEDSPRGGIPPRTEIELDTLNPTLETDRIRGQPPEARTIGPTGINPETDQGLKMALSPTTGLRADPLLEAVDQAPTPHGAGQAGPCPRTGPAGPPPGIPGGPTPL